MSWRDVLKYIEGEEESYESPSFKKAEEKLRLLMALTIPQDMRMLEVLSGVDSIRSEITRRELESVLGRSIREIEKLKQIKKKFDDENPQSDDDELLDEMFQDSDSEFATDRGYQMLMNNVIDGVPLGFGAYIFSQASDYQQLFRRRKL